MFLAIPISISFLLAICGAYWNRHFQLDDALIYYRYVENMLNGYGLVYNIGELHNALTSPFYTYLLLAASFLSGGHIHASAIIIGMLSECALAIALIFYFRDKVPHLVLIAIPFLLFSTYYFYGIYGMETLLYLALAITCLCLFEKQHWGWLGITAALMVLTRNETVFLLLALALEHRLRRLPFPPLKAYLLPALLCFAHFAFTYFYYGQFLPHSANVKTTQAMSGLWGKWPVFLHVGYMPDMIFDKQISMMVLIIFTSLIGLFDLYKSKQFRPWFVFLGLYTTFYVGMNIPNYHWYYAPYFLTIVIGNIGFIAWVMRISSPNMRKPIAALCVVALVSMNGIILYKKMQYQQPHPHYPKIGIWLRENLPPKASVGVVEIGTIGWYSKHPIIDMIGLVTPKNAEWLAERKFDQWVLYYKPDYLMLHRPLWPHEEALRYLRRDTHDYVRIETFPFKHYQLWQRVK